MDEESLEETFSWKSKAPGASAGAFSFLRRSLLHVKLDCQKKTARIINFRSSPILLTLSHKRHESDRQLRFGHDVPAHLSKDGQILD